MFELPDSILVFFWLVPVISLFLFFLPEIIRVVVLVFLKIDSFLHGVRE